MNERDPDNQLRIPNMDQWQAGEVLAVYDLCQAISCALMARYQDELLEQMMLIDTYHELQQQEQTESDARLGVALDDSF